MNVSVAFMEALAERLEDLGVFDAGIVAIVGESTAALELAGLFEMRGREAHVIGLPDADAHGRSGRIVCLRDSAGEDPRILEKARVVLIVSTHAEVLREVLSAVPPLCRILAIGPLDGSLDEVDFYATVHRNNLELTRIRLD